MKQTLINMAPHLAILLPLSSGLIPALIFLRKSSKKNVLSLAHGVVAHFILLTCSFPGLILSGYLNPEVYADLGDNPGVMRGWAYGLQISVPVLVYAWLRYRYISKKQNLK